MTTRCSFAAMVGPVAALLFAAGPAFAATGELSGKVMDRTGQALPGVTLVLRNDSLGVPERGTLTDTAGDYHFRGLPPGPGYRLRVTLASFSPVEFSDLEVPDGGIHTQDIVLRPASELEQTIRVRGQAETVRPDTVVTSTTFGSEFIAGLPVLGRDYQDILTLAPGVTDVNSTGNPNIHGARDTDVITLVDGVSTTDPFTGYYGQQLNIESIQEVEVITSGAPAEFSRAQGGFANILTKSGGNEFEGTFKFFFRSSRLDQDGAGTEPAELRGGLGGENSLSDLKFTDLYPFLSLSGAFVKDRLWYYLSTEYIQVETPVNVITQAYIVPTRGYRLFGKTTAQLSAAHKGTFSIILDQEENENLGLDSLTDTESGYTFKRGGPTFTLKENAVFGPTRLLESSLSWFDNRFQRVPTLDPDTNGNGILYVDGRPDLGGNRDGFLQAHERDPGVDYDRDGRYDIFEDWNHDGILEAEYEDEDFDGRLTGPMGCEGADHEDINCNGLIDVEMDLNKNGLLDPAEDQGIPCSIPALCPSGYIPGTRQNGRFDTEDANGNGLLDTTGESGFTPFPFWVDSNGDGIASAGEFLAPLAPDRDYTRDAGGRTSGPNPYESDDHRTRFSLREDFSLYVDDLGGTHDMKIGAVYEREGYDGELILRPILREPRARNRGNRFTGPPPAPTLGAFMGIPTYVDAEAHGENLGLYFQDTYKPIPNLTLGLGVRIDLERLDSLGYTSFDPVAERRSFDALMAASGVDTRVDSVLERGLTVDPLYQGGGGDPLHLAQINSSIRNTAPQRMTRHQASVDVLGAFLSGFLGNNADINDLIAQGYSFRRPESFEIQNTNVAPRVSLTWDPWADGKSKGFVSWSRFYDKLFLNTMVLEQGPDSVSRLYSFDPDGVDTRGFPDNRFGRILSQSPPTAYQVDRNLTTPYTDELSLGFQREIAPELMVGITYIHRDYRNQLQDIDINHHTVIDPTTGRYMDFLGQELIARDPKQFNVHQPDGLPDLYIENFFFNRVFRLGNSNDQTYRGIELQLVRRLSRKWQLAANYTRSESKGDAESWISEVGDDPSLTEYESGFLDYDQTHVVKVSATAFLPGDWRLGGTAQWASGLPWSFMLRQEANDDVGYVQSRRVFGRIGENGFVPESRNDHRNDSVYTFNVRTEKSFVIGKSSATAFLEVFNLLNSDDLRIATIDDSNFQLQIDGERRFGRRYQVGLTINF